MDDVKRDEQKHRVFNENDIMPVLEEVLQSGGECRLIVTGYSMVPTLKHKRDSVILISPEHRKIKKGEIVLIRRSNGKYILHRVFRTLDNGHLIINGDSQMWSEVVRRDQVKGVAERLIRNGREISCSSLIYKLYSRLWMALRPWRQKIFSLRGRMKGAVDYEGRRQ